MSGREAVLAKVRAALRPPADDAARRHAVAARLAGSPIEYKVEGSTDMNNALL